MIIDNLELVQNIQNGVIKASDRVRDGSASIYEIIETMQTMTIGVHVDYANDWAKKKKDNTFEINSGLFLIRDCD